jgi:hypothetical protein
MRFVIQTSSHLLPRVVMRIRKNCSAAYRCKTRSLIEVFNQGHTNPGSQFAARTKFCMAGPNICGFSVWNYVSPVWILRLLLGFWKICALQLLSKENMWNSDRLREWTDLDLNVKVKHWIVVWIRSWRIFLWNTKNHMGDDIKKWWREIEWNGLMIARSGSNWLLITGPRCSVQHILHTQASRRRNRVYGLQ